MLANNQFFTMLANNQFFTMYKPTRPTVTDHITAKYIMIRVDILHAIIIDELEMLRKYKILNIKAIRDAFNDVKKLHNIYKSSSQCEDCTEGYLKRISRISQISLSMCEHLNIIAKEYMNGIKELILTCNTETRVIFESLDFCDFYDAIARIEQRCNSDRITLTDIKNIHEDYKNMKSRRDNIPSHWNIYSDMDRSIKQTNQMITRLTFMNLEL